MKKAAQFAVQTAWAASYPLRLATFSADRLFCYLNRSCLQYGRWAGLVKTDFQIFGC